MIEADRLLNILTQYADQKETFGSLDMVRFGKYLHLGSERTTDMVFRPEDLPALIETLRGRMSRTFLNQWNGEAWSVCYRDDLLDRPTPDESPYHLKGSKGMVSFGQEAADRVIKAALLAHAEFCAENYQGSKYNAPSN